MRFILSKANFSGTGKNIGTLNSWFISKNTPSGLTWTSIPSSVDKGSNFNAVAEIDTANYELVTMSVTMGTATQSGIGTSGGITISKSGSRYTITISSVTANVNISVTTKNLSTGTPGSGGSGGNAGGGTTPTPPSGGNINFTNFSFEAGTLDANTGANFSNSATDLIRIRMVDYIEFPETSYIRVTPPTGYVWAIHEYDKTTSQQTYCSQEWQNTSIFSVKTNCKYKFKFKKANDANISLADMASFTITGLQESNAINNTSIEGWKQGGFENGTYTSNSKFCRTDKFRLQNNGIISVDSNNQYIQIWKQSTLEQGGTQGPQITSGWFSDNGIFRVDAGIYCIALVNSDQASARTDITPNEVTTIITIKEFGS